MNKYIPIIFILIAVFSCKKENLIEQSAGNLQFSNDTITFDTIFTSRGSITKTLIVYNNNNSDLITDIKLKKSSSAHFRINIDGIPGESQNNITIPANDSIFIFVEVTIDPSENNLPYILTDSLVFTTKEKKQNIYLVAWGQNAYFHTPNTYGQIIQGTDTTKFYYHKLDCNITWDNEKPHVIYGYVVIDPTCELNIDAGTQIHCHKNSGIIVGNPFSEIAGGTLKINGELGDEVIIQGDRLDGFYKEIPGQWDRIWMTPGSINNEINYAIIKNGSIGIHADTTGNSANPTVTINNTIIENMSSIGILGQGTNIEANNTIINNCGQYTIACNIGGTYNFTHCTFANYWNYDHRKNPSILLNNYYEGNNGEEYPRKLKEANFTNCIIYGGLSTEISFQESTAEEFNYFFDHCLIKIEDVNISSNNIHYNNNIINQDPQFINTNIGDLNLEVNSPAIDMGKNTLINFDILQNQRNNPDIGAYEFTN